MIASLRGRLADKHPNRLVVDVNGVGYEVFVPLSTFYRVAATLNSTPKRTSARWILMSCPMVRSWKTKRWNFDPL